MQICLVLIGCLHLHRNKLLGYQKGWESKWKYKVLQAERQCWRQSAPNNAFSPNRSTCGAPVYAQGEPKTTKKPQVFFYSALYETVTDEPLPAFSIQAQCGEHFRWHLDIYHQLYSLQELVFL